METKNYEKFNLIQWNREKIDDKHVSELVESIKLNNLLKYRPILVNKNMEVIDGQHRLLAAQRLGVPIYYEIDEKDDADSIILLNNVMKKWTLDDYLNYYCHKGLKNYTAYRDLMKKYDLSLNNLMIFIGGYNGISLDIFRRGKLKKIVEEDISFILDRVRKCNKIIKDLLPYSECLFIHRRMFLRAQVYFFRNKNIDHEIFYKNVEKKLEWMRSCTTTAEYLKMLERVYNYNNRNPIHLDKQEN